MVRRRRQNKRKEWTRNLFLILLAVGVVVIFFNLDLIQDGESVFSRSADRKLRFAGDFERKDYTSKEIDRLLNYIKKNNDIIDKMTLKATKQDSYRKVTPSTQVLFEIQLLLADEAKIATPTRRTTRKNLVSQAITKMAKDLKAYRRIKKKGGKVKSLVNTM